MAQTSRNETEAFQREVDVTTDFQSVFTSAEFAFVGLLPSSTVRGIYRPSESAPSAGETRVFVLSSVIIRVITGASKCRVCSVNIIYICPIGTNSVQEESSALRDEKNMVV